MRDTCRKASGLELPLLSGGNSANLPLLASGKCQNQPSAHWRGDRWGGMCSTAARGRERVRTFRLVAEVVEVERKPSIPIGHRQDALAASRILDRGIRQRAICKHRTPDVVIDGITRRSGIMSGGSSDHLVLDVEEAAEPVEVGSEIAFYPGYGALLAASTSVYVQKVVMKD